MSDTTARDTLVIFGITVDRARVMTFRSRYRLEGRGLIVQPLLVSPPPVLPYTPGSWGPAAVDDLVARHRPWHEPWMGDASTISGAAGTD